MNSGNEMITDRYDIKKENFSELRKMVEIYLGTDAFELYPDESYSIITVRTDKSLKELPDKYVKIYWASYLHRDRDRESKNYLGLKISSGYPTSYTRYKYDIIMNMEVAYLFEGISSAYFHIIKVDLNLINKLKEIEKREGSKILNVNPDSSKYYKYPLSEIEDSVIYASYNKTKVFTGKTSNKDETSFMIHMFRNIIKNKKERALTYAEILEESEKIIMDNYFVPILKIYGHYQMKEGNKNKAIFESDINNYLRVACKKDALRSVKYDNHNNFYIINESFKDAL